MMHECPKCGFVQPQDQYCANCGLDIENYKPAPEPLLKKLGKNTVLQVLIVIVTLLAVTTYIFIKQKEVIEKHFALTQQNLDEVSPLLDTNSEDETLNGATESVGAPTNEVVDTSPSSVTESPTKANKSAALNSADKITPLIKHELVITFAEASNSLLQQLASEGQILNETAQRRSFSNPNIEAVDRLKDRDSEFRTLAGGESEPLAVGSSLVFDFTHISGHTNDNVGLDLEITPVALGENNIELNLTGQLHLKAEDGSTIASQEINANYLFPNKSTLLMVGFLPRQSIRQEDLHGFSNTPLAIFESLQLINGLTDFVIFIQIK